MNYKSYQQIINLSGSKSRSKARPAKTEDTHTAKKRTKSGCLTCRKRKKKCDEDTEGGKCQACIRNFLDCCWAGDSTPKVAALTSGTPDVVFSAPKRPILQVKPDNVTPMKGASAYPSPISSPKVQPLEENETVKRFSLPSTKTKVEKPRGKQRSSKATPEFIVTSFDTRNALCQIK